MPQRFLRPGLTNSERFNKVSLHAQSLWLRILTRVDDFGRYDARASVLAGELFSVWNELHPEDAVNPQRIPALRCELQAAGLAEFYTSEGKEVVQLLQWEERARANRSKWPNPQESAAERSGTQRNPASLASTSSPSPSPLVPASNGEPEFTEAMAMTWLKGARKNGADYTEAEMHKAFLAGKSNGWKWGGSDKRAALERQILWDRDHKPSNSKEEPQSNDDILKESMR